MKRSVVFNPALLSAGVCGAAISAESGPTEERRGRERAPGSLHQDRQTDGKGCTSMSALNPLIHLRLPESSARFIRLKMSPDGVTSRPDWKMERLSRLFLSDSPAQASVF